MSGAGQPAVALDYALDFSVAVLPGVPAAMRDAVAFGRTGNMRSLRKPLARHAHHATNPPSAVMNAPGRATKPICLLRRPVPDQALGHESDEDADGRAAKGAGADAVQGETVAAPIDDSSVYEAEKIE